MARIDVKYDCGCGYSTKSLEEAIKHAESQKHTLTALGTIKPENK